jgi:hypothetical protein
VTLESDALIAITGHDFRIQPEIGLMPKIECSQMISNFQIQVERGHIFKNRVPQESIRFSMA